MNWVPYDPTWLIQAASQQESEDSALLAALADCTSGSWESTAYIYFVDPDDANWEVDRGVGLEDTPFGFVAVDILKDGRVGGVEFVDKVMGRRESRNDRKPWRRRMLALLVSAVMISSAVWFISLSNDKLLTPQMLGSLFRAPSHGIASTCGKGTSMADQVYLKAKPHPGDQVVPCTECAGPDVTTRLYKSCESLGFRDDCKWNQMQPWARGQGRMGVRFPDGSALWLQGKVDWAWEAMDVQAVVIERAAS